MKCPHGMPSVSSCVECQMDGETLPPAPRPQRVVGHAFEARIDGWCNGCDLPISVGQRIVRVTRADDERGGYVHETCT